MIKASVAERPKAADSCAIRFLSVKGHNKLIVIQKLAKSIALAM